ncbi:MAG: helix-turn-helix domain-containing protein [Chloroflexota bacterium]|nr:helix-turn-helix domain-containing protein [Chloroflexota bacterium]
MTTPNEEPRFHGSQDHIIIGGRLLPLESGVLPPDFPQRLIRLKEASGLSWTAFAHALGVDRKQVLRWTKGVEPCGGAMLALIRFAMRIPGGLDILLGEEPPQQDEEDRNGA